MAYASAQPYRPRYYDANPNPYAPINAHISSSPAAAYPPPSSVVIDSPVFSQPYYLPHHHHHHPNPAPPLPVAPVATPEQQKINTLFVSGLPDDVKAREIHNLFRRHQGFDTCQLKYTGRGNQVVAFATFFSHQSAMAAMTALNGVTFDPQTGATLHIELARSNSRTRSRGTGAYVIIDKRTNITADQETLSSDGDGGSDEPEGALTINPGNKGVLATVRSGDIQVKAENTEAAPNDQSGDIPPCSTLFIANLGPTCTEEELRQVLSAHDGFQTLKMRGKVGMPVAFADFVDIESSTAAMTKLQDISLASSDRGGMHLEYARSKMRKI